MKNAYFFLKALFILKIFNFGLDFFNHRGKELDKKAKINFKIYGVTIWKKAITIHLLPNIARSKENQTMKFG